MDAPTCDDERPHFVITVDDFPDEIIRAIFSYFTPQQLCSRQAHVCTRWHRISREPYLWRRLTLDNITVPSLVALFRTAPVKELKSITVKHRDCDIAPLTVLLSTHCPSIIELDYSVSLVNRDCLSALAASCPNIAKLALARISCGADTNDNRVFDGFAKLTDLELGISLFDLRAPPFLGCTNLSSLSVSLYASGFYSAQADEYFAQFIARYHTVLRALKVDADFREALSSESCATFAASCVNLEELYLKCARNLTDETFAMLAANLSRLRSLSLFGASKTTAAGLISVFSRTDWLTNMTQLRLICCPAVSDSVVTAIADRFAAQLVSLMVSECGDVTDRSAAQVVLKCSNLEELLLDGNRSLNGTFIQTIPKCLRKLKLFKLYGCNVNREYVAALKNAMPDLRVVYF